MNYLDNICIELYTILDLLLKNVRNKHNVNNTFILIFHFLFLFKSLINFFYIHFDNYTNDLKKYHLNLLYITTDLDNTHYNLLKKYNDLNLIHEHITYKKLLENNIYIKPNAHLNSNIITNNVNLEIYSIECIIDSIASVNNYSYNKAPYEYVNIGFDNMYKVKNGNMKDYIVNSNHILTVSVKLDDYNKISKFINSINESLIFDINIQDYLKLPKDIKELVKGVVNSNVIEWKEQKVDTSPYIFGIRFFKIVRPIIHL